MRFRYKLQPLLNVRRQLENSAKYELGKHLQALDHAQKQLNRILNEQQECCERIVSESMGRIEIGKLRQYGCYFRTIDERIKQQTESVNHIQNNVNICREKLIKASKDKKILEKLKERKYSEFLYEQLKAEEKITDQVVSYRYAK